MRRPVYTSSIIDLRSVTRKVPVDNRISLRNYYRIADNLLKQANIYREEKNLIDLYIILLRYSSLVSETIPFHKDYQALHPKERTFFRKKLLGVLDELETLKPKARRQLEELERVKKAATQTHQTDGATYSSRVSSSSYNNKKMVPAITSPSSLKQNNGSNRVSSSNSVDLQFQKLSLGLPLPKQETLSRHSLLGPNGLRAQWQGPSAEFKVNYPTNSIMDLSEIASLDQVGQNDSVTKKENDLNLEKSSMDSVLSLDDGRWLDEESSLPPLKGTENKDIELGSILQLSPPPVMAQTHPIPPHLVADPRPGPPKELRNGLTSTSSYQDLHIPVRMLEDFLRLAQANTAKNLETCGVLAGSLRNRVFYISTLIVPKQESTSDSCQTLNEEELFEIQDSRSLFQLGWIHTHPTQTCFMSSVDLHTHYSYQVMLPEAIAIVMAPTDTSSPHGIFHLSDPGGVSVMRNCEQRGFHPHEEPEDGSPLYEHCSHVYMNANLKFDVIDLRCV